MSKESDIFNNLSTEKFVRKELNGYSSSGELEALSSMVNNQEEFLAKLTSVLEARGLLSREEIFEMVRGYKFIGNNGYYY